MRKGSLDGLAGWLCWLFIHIAFLTGYRNRIGAILTWALAFTRETRRERAFTTAAIDTARDVYSAERTGLAAEQAHTQAARVVR